MKNLSILLLPCCFLYAIMSCKGEKSSEKESIELKETIEKKQPKPIKVDSISIPEGYTKIGDVLGNLDEEEDEERVIIYDTDREVEMGTEREIRVYKQTYDGAWSLIHKSVGAVLPSRHGGMMGDPFEQVYIERKCIVIDHFGGSREKWNYTHRYRYQNKEWQLIGASIRYGAPCDYWDYFDYNLSIGKIEVKKEKENCDDESQNEVKTYSFVRKMKDELPKMDGFYPGDNEIQGRDGDVFYY